jgi:hypothetical protein
VVAGALQYFSSRYLDDRRHRRDLRTQAYTDLLKCLSESAQPAATSQGRYELRAKAADAKARICLYGSHEVVQAISAFETLGATISDSRQAESFLNMVLAMRRDSGGEYIQTTAEIAPLLLGASE